MTEKDMELLTKTMYNMMSNMMDEKLKPVNERLDKMDERLDKIDEELETIKVNTEITRVAANEAGKWIEKYFKDDYPFPVDDKKVI
jgi:tetrahydromethanopterin S-methyltransferase subunit G